MIKSIKQITKFMAVVLLLALGSCEKDLYDEVIQSEKQNFTVKKISLSDLSKKDNLKLFKKVDEVKSISKKVNGKIVYDDKNNIYFDDENGKLVENAFGEKSYTFPMYKTSSADDKMENIVFQEKENGDYDIYKTKYSFTEEQLKNFTEQEIEQQTITYSEISQGKISIVCVAVVVWELVYAQGQGGIPTQAPPSHYEWVVKSYKCTNVADNTTDFNAGGSGIDGLGCGACGGINTTPVENNYYYLVNPHNPDSNYLNLNPSQISWLNSQTKETRKEIMNYGFQNSGEVDFVSYCINYLIANPTTTFEQFQNWFMGTSEGIDGEYDAAYWENPSLTFPPQNLPTYDQYLQGMPRFANGTFMIGADNVYGLVGGDVQQKRLQYPALTNNTCALKVSIALNRSGIIIPNIPGKTFEGGGVEFTGKYFFLNAKSLNSWMRETFGTNPSTTSTPFNSNHISYTGSQGGVNGINFPSLLSNVKGIFSMITTETYINSGGATGHADLIFPSNTNNLGTCIYGCNFNLPIERIDIWKLN